MKKDEVVKKIKAENGRHRTVLTILLWFLFMALMNITANAVDGTAFIVWISIVVLGYILGGFIMMCYLYTGSINFFRYFMEKKLEPVVKPLVSFTVYKMLDEYKIELNTVKGYEYLLTDIVGRHRLIEALNNKKLRFITIPEIEDWNNDIHEKIINIDNITTINSVQQSNTETSNFSISPKEAREAIKEHIKRGYTLKTLEAVNDEAKVVVEQLKEQLFFKEIKN